MDNQRVAVVTGGSGGIGRVVAERLGADGMSVLVHYAGNRERADEAVKAVEAAGGRAVAARADLTDADQATALFETAERTFGGVDVVVNTAGIMVLAPLTELSLDDFDRMLDTNVRGTFLVARAAAPKLRRGGALITFSSSVVGLAHETYSGYVAAKAGVEAMTRVLAKEMRGRDVTVNAVAPGPTATSFFLDGKDQATIDRFASAAPLERLGTPEDTAEVVAFLAGPARWINGQIVRVNGGII
ncbi:SDR family oxidoreductase [Catenuloplanes atrovinosus]|uniref:3-oxoacyl-[acyl-carrier protein] reductase n=1 Tax=Catenuloplanes atrovinosus TaxID=137266 RepID=A0AAE4CAU5_9ACTN|nr:SDR family oxidoreductase [Catenuloplanes atrovinosus]MDR7277438.1 3-oxoacyl-[acyl-carrier protein] reductase [Catenuloplanes atrovinosus]